MGEIKIAPNRFALGNPGKKKGTICFHKRKLADAAREMFEEHAPKLLTELLTNKKTPAAIRMRAIEFLAERGYGRAPVTVRHGIDSDSAEGVLLALARQHIPGLDEEMNIIEIEAEIINEIEGDAARGCDEPQE